MNVGASNGITQKNPVSFQERGFFMGRLPGYLATTANFFLNISIGKYLASFSEAPEKTLSFRKNLPIFM